METRSQGCVRSVTQVAVSASGVGRTAAWAALWVSSSCGKKDVASPLVLRDTTTIRCTGPASPAMPAAKHAQVYFLFLSTNPINIKTNNVLVCLSVVFNLPRPVCCSVPSSLALKGDTSLLIFKKLLNNLLKDDVNKITQTRVNCTLETFSSRLSALGSFSRRSVCILCVRLAWNKLRFPC